MNKKYTYVLFGLCLFFWSFNCDVVSASEFKFNVYPEPAVVSSSLDEVKLKFVVESASDSITNCTFNVFTSSGVKYVRDDEANGWNITTGINGYLLDSTNGTSNGSVVIMNSVYQVINDATITISNIECGSSEADKVFKVKDIKVNVGVSDDVNIKIDGYSVSGGVANPLSVDKNNFNLSVVTGNASLQDSVKVMLVGIECLGTDCQNTVYDKELCVGDECKDLLVDFKKENFCLNSECLVFKPTFGNSLRMKVLLNDSEVKTFYVIKEAGNAPVLDPSLEYLKVWGHEIELVEGQREYNLPIKGEVTDYSVVARLSDPDNFIWHEEDNPDKYDFETNLITLIFLPKDPSALGAEDVVYIINIEYDGEGGSSSSSQPSDDSSSSSSSSSSTPKPSNGGNNAGNNSNVDKNAPTGGISEFVVAIILFVSLFFVLTLYKKNMEEYDG